MRKSITKKMIAVVVLIIVILVAGLALMNLVFFQEFTIWQNQRKMISQGDIIAAHFETIEMNHEAIRAYENEFSEITESYNLNVRILNQSYDILLDSSSFQTPSRMKIQKQTIDLIEMKSEEIDSKEYCFITMNDNDTTNPHILYVRKLDDKYYLLISRTIKSIDEDIETSNVFLLITGCIVTVLGIAIVARFARGFTKPILAINEMAQRISCLDFSEKIPVNSQDELGELANSMNLISDCLSESINQLKNDLDKRNQLVRDMSHELKTPVTAIKGYSEALKYGIAKNPEKAEKYCDIIVQECDRVNSLIYEMIQLFKMDSLSDAIKIEPIDLDEIMEEIMDQYHISIANKKVNVQVEFNPNIISGDARVLKRAIKNLVDNAIRYVNENGVLRISGIGEAGTYTIKVYNSGSSIPENELNSVWDVFYKVDQARKREHNTYGIGLAIVKSAVEVHHGYAEVVNIEDGVEFRMILPQEKN